MSEYSTAGINNNAIEIKLDYANRPFCPVQNRLGRTTPFRYNTIRFGFLPCRIFYGKMSCFIVSAVMCFFINFICERNLVLCNGYDVFNDLFILSIKIIRIRVSRDEIDFDKSINSNTSFRKDRQLENNPTFVEKRKTHQNLFYGRRVPVEITKK